LAAVDPGYSDDQEDAPRRTYKPRVAKSYLCDPRVCDLHDTSAWHCNCGVELQPGELDCFWCRWEAAGGDPNDLAAVHRWLARDLTGPRTSAARMPGERGW
jgi:hypothetical protein